MSVVVPGTFNRYVYVLNNPVNLMDRNGLDVCAPDDGNDDSGDGGGNDACSGGGGPAAQPPRTANPPIPDPSPAADSAGPITLALDSFLNAFSDFEAELSYIEDGPLASTNVISTSELTGLWNDVKSFFGYDPSVPLPSCFGNFENETIEIMNPLSPPDPTDQGRASAQATAKTVSLIRYNAALSGVEARGVMYPNNPASFEDS